MLQVKQENGAKRRAAVAEAKPVVSRCIPLIWEAFLITLLRFTAKLYLC